MGDQAEGSNDKISTVEAVQVNNKGDDNNIWENPQADDGWGGTVAQNDVNPPAIWGASDQDGLQDQKNVQGDGWNPDPQPQQQNVQDDEWGADPQPQQQTGQDDEWGADPQQPQQTVQDDDWGAADPKPQQNAQDNNWGIASGWDNAGNETQISPVEENNAKSEPANAAQGTPVDANNPQSPLVEAFFLFMIVLIVGIII